MKWNNVVFLPFLAFLLFSCSQKTFIGKSEKRGKHLFILSGQSNMQLLLPEESFSPTLASEFGRKNIVVVKDALGAQPIRRWYKNWEPPVGKTLSAQPDLYDSLMKKVYSVIESQQFRTVTFVWMQGERDAREELGDVYEKSLIGLYDQLSKNLNRDDIHFVIGRLSDFDMNNAKYPHWTMIRTIQEKVGSSNPRYDWIDTDDCNDGANRAGKPIQNDLHMSAEGYVTMGRRFAEKAIQLIKNNL